MDGTLAAVKKSMNLEQAIKLGDFFADMQIMPAIFFTMVGILTVSFIIRYAYLIKMNRVKFKTKKLRYLGHLLLELLLSIIVSYFIIELTHAKMENYVVNWIIAPSIGFISSIYIHNKYIVPYEKMGDLKVKEKKETATVSTKKTDDEALSSFLTIEKIHRNDLENDEYESIVRDRINKLIINQERSTEALEKQTDILNILKECQLEEQRGRLKEMIYDCLSQGYVTPKQDEKIRHAYYVYHKVLGGNHEISELYNKRYLNLKVLAKQEQFK